MHFTSYLAPLFLSLALASPIVEKEATAQVIKRTVSPEVCIPACVLACAFDPPCIAICVGVCSTTVEPGEPIGNAELIDGVWNFS